MATTQIPYNPQTDPRQYAIQGIQNFLGGILEQHAKKQRTLDIQDLSNWAGSGEAPRMRTQTGQQIVTKMLDPMYQARLQSEKARTAYWKRPRKTDTYKPVTRANISTSRTKALQILKKTPKRLWKVGVPNYTKQNLMESYKQYQLDRGYDGLEAEDKNKLDTVWDKTIAYLNRKPGMSTKGEFDWDPNDPDIQAIRGAEPRKTEGKPQADFESSAQAQSAPMVEFDELWSGLNLNQKEAAWKLNDHWPDLPGDEKTEILQAMRNNPENIFEILRILEGG